MPSFQRSSWALLYGSYSRRVPRQQPIHYAGRYYTFFTTRKYINAFNKKWTRWLVRPECPVSLTNRPCLTLRLSSVRYSAWGISCRWVCRMLATVTSHCGVIHFRQGLLYFRSCMLPTETRKYGRNQTASTQNDFLMRVGMCVKTNT